MIRGTLNGSPVRIEQRLSNILCGALLAFFVLAGPSPAVAEKAIPAPLYEDARDRFDKRDYTGAIIQLKSALQKNPENLPARILLGHAYLEIKESQAAIKELTIARRSGADDAFTLVPLAKAYEQIGQHGRILAEIRNGNRDPDLEADIRLIRGKAYMALNKLDKAQRAFAEVARYRPKSAAAYIEYARLQLKRKDADAAEELVGAARLRAPENAEVWLVSGDLKRYRRDFEGAVVDFSKALELDPEHEGAREARAATLVDLRRFKEAESDVLLLREKSPGNPRAIYFHALILSDAGKPKEAKAVLDQASELLEAIEPEILSKTPPAVLLAGMVAYLRKDFEVAHNHLTRYVAMAPFHVSSRRTLATILMRRGNADKAIKILRQARVLAPKNVRIMAMLGKALMDKRLHAEAAELFERAAVLAPKNAKIQLNLGLTRFNIGQQDRAAEALKNALALNAEETAAAVLLSLTHLRRGRFEEALQTSQALIEQEPKNAFAHNVKGAAQMALGRLPDARASLEESLRADPSYQAARFNLAKLELRRGDLVAGEAQYQEILKANEKSTRAMVALSRIAKVRGEIDTAIRWLEKARSVDSGLVAEQIQLAKLYGEIGDSNAAIQVLRMLVRNSSKNPAALEALALMEAESGARDTALKSFNRLAAVAEFQKSAEWLVRVARHQMRLEAFKPAADALKSAVRFEPKYLPAQKTLFDLDIHLGQFKEAQRRVADLRLDYPSSPIGLTLSGDLAMRQGRPLEAAKYYDSGFREFRSPALLIRLYKAHAAAGRAKRMIGLLKSWIDEHPKDTAVRRVYAAGLMEIGREAESRTLHEALLKEAPDDPALLNNLALLYYSADDPRALPYAENAFKRAPRAAGAIDTYGWLLVQNDQAVKGLEMLRNAQARAPNVAEIKYHIAVAFYRLGRRDEARRELEAVLSSGESFKGQADAHTLWKQLSGG